jgi:ubiquinone/menaquinone biosynthesis C-methylase UbiE
MNGIRHVKPDFPEDAFAGTAAYYAKYRVPYPRVLTGDLLKRAGVTGKGRLLDLACGPGRIALSIAFSFRDVWAIDLEPEMINVGREEARKRGIGDIRWMVGRAEEMKAETGSFELITIGEAFHRLVSG